VSGHVFVVRGDLTQIACDAVLVPASSAPDITPSWRPLFAQHRLGAPNSLGWSHVALDLPDGWGEAVRAARVPEDSQRRQVWLVRTDSHGRDPAWVAQSLVEGVQRAAAALPSEGRRAKRLIGLPLAGTGDGGLAQQRGAVVEALVPALEEAVRAHDVDVALVLHDARDHVAVQARREDPGCLLLDRTYLDHADRLGELAAKEYLVLFLGAGVSRAAGLPSWSGLLAELAEKADISPASLEALSAPDAAQIAADVLGDRFYAFMSERFAVRRHALAHSLLAALQAPSVVTTNYDNGYELAAAVVQSGNAPLRVLPQEQATPGSPWLLKMHGDAQHPESIVLTRSQYLEYGDLRTPLAGMVQALLMTRHMLFVGFSLVDDNFARLAYQVRRLLNAGGQSDQRVGTVLFLRRDPLRERLWQQDLDPVAMTDEDGDEGEAARLLEVFLDRVAWKATRARGGVEQLLLDKRYDGMVRPSAEADLRKRLRALAADATPEERATPAWQAVARALAELGAPGS
jgi:hypothetical protein